jgi:hypothetical protein
MSPAQAKRLIPVVIALLLGGYWTYVVVSTPPRTFVNWLPGVPPSYDADMAYLYNSLLPFEGHTYAHVYHPNTALHIVGTAVAALTWPIAQAQGVNVAALHAGDPFPLLWTLRSLLLVFGIIVSVLLFQRSVPLDDWGSVALAAACGVAFFAIYSFGFISLVSWAHASMGYTVGGLILLVLLAWAVRAEAPRRWEVIGLGAAAGVLNATAYYYLPFIVTVALAAWGLHAFYGRGWVRGFGWAVVSGLSSIAGFLLINAPIWTEFNRFLASFVQLSSSRGVHGSGETGLTTFGDLVNGAAEIYALYPVSYWALGGLIVFAAGLALVQRRRLRENANLWTLILAGAVHVLLGALLIFRHPGGSYINIVAPVAPFLLAVLFRLMTTPNERRVALAMATALLVGFGVQYGRAYALQAEVVRIAQERAADVDALVNERVNQTGQVPSDVEILTKYGAHFGCYGMLFGSNYANHLLYDYVAAACPNLARFEANFDGARLGAPGWRVLTEADFCWDYAVVTDYDGSGLLAEFAAPYTTDSGYLVIENDRTFRPRGAFRHDFETLPCGRGWGNAPELFEDTTYAWTSTPEATVEFRLQPGTNYELTLQLFAAIAPDVEESLAVHINGTPLALAQFGPGQYTATIPAALVDANPYATPFKLITNRVEVPGPERGDLRSLGVAVDYIEIVPEQEAAF